MAKHFQDCLHGGSDESCRAFRDNTMGVRLIKPVDIYQQSERALKYGFLFVGLAFAVFFFFAVLKGMRIHVMQYSLVGISLTLFFLLVVALSEHLRFDQAYAVAAGACSSWYSPWS